MGIWGTLVALLAPRAPQLEFAWEAPPIVRRCDDAPVTREALAEAVAWWEDRGARFAGIEEAGRCFFDADGAPLGRKGVAWRTITVTRRTLPEAGHTTWTAYAGIPLWAVVYLGGDDPNVVVHELGHALGFPHVHRAGHVMNPTLNGIGWGEDGLAEALNAQ